MRIITGRYKGRRFDIPRTFKARPTTDFAKENIFNVINGYTDWEETTALDLFAGTGSISYEFVSRGARSVTGIEMNTKQIDFIKRTCTRLKIDNLHVYRSDVFKYIAKCSERYDVVFADPPYQMNNIDELLAAVVGNSLLTDDSIFILEHNRHHSFADHPNLIDSRKYGNVHFSLFRAMDGKLQHSNNINTSIE